MQNLLTLSFLISVKFIIFEIYNIIREKTCFKNQFNPSCIDVTITNRPKSFQNSMVIDTCITAMKMYYSKQKPPIIHYRKFKDFNDSFIKDLQIILTKLFNEEPISFQVLRESVNVNLEKHAP